MVGDTHSTPCLRNIQNLLLEFLRKLHFENVIKMVTDCLRLQEIGVDFLKIFLGVAPHTPPPYSQKHSKFTLRISKKITL